MIIDEKSEKIAKLNDDLRTGANTLLGQIVVTKGVAEMPETERYKLFNVIQKVNEFPEEDNPYGERDFGMVMFAGDKFFWKIDYFDKEKRHGSPDPSDPDITCRILTIMRAEEY